MLDVISTNYVSIAARDSFMRTGQGFLILYSITSRSAFECVPSQYEQILRVKDEDKVPVIVVGNKCDLEDRRCVSTEEGRTLAKQIDCPFYETSALARINVDEVFDSLINEIRKYRSLRENRDHNNQQNPNKKGKCSTM